MATTGQKHTNMHKARARLLVCGGRDFKDKALVFQVLDDLCLKRGWILPPSEDGNWLPDVVVIHGNARGADSLADFWATINWQQVLAFPADWENHGKGAGPIRNQQMIDEGKPDIVVAFPGGRGTADMVRRAKKAGLEVIEI